MVVLAGSGWCSTSAAEGLPDEEADEAAEEKHHGEDTEDEVADMLKQTRGLNVLGHGQHLSHRVSNDHAGKLGRSRLGAPTGAGTPAPAACRPRSQLMPRAAAISG